MPKELKSAPEKISVQKRSKVANVSHVVDRWSTRVKGDGARRFLWPDWLGRSAQRIVQLQHRELPDILIEHSVEKEKEELIKLSTAVNNLFKLSLNAFAKKDFELAEKVRNEDIDIDKLYKGFFNSLLEKMSKDSKLAVPGTHMLFISKNLERIGDHATNVAETITYMASGEIKVEPRPKIN